MALFVLDGWPVQMITALADAAKHVQVRCDSITSIRIDNIFFSKSTIKKNETKKQLNFKIFLLFRSIFHRYMLCSSVLIFY